jgi:hypothetical protein
MSAICDACHQTAGSCLPACPRRASSSTTTGELLPTWLQFLGRALGRRA